MNGEETSPLGTEEKPAWAGWGRYGEENSPIKKIRQQVPFRGVRWHLPMAQDFGDFMRKKLDSLDKSQRWLEREMGYKDGSFRAVMVGRQEPRLRDLGRMSKVLGLSLEESLKLRDLGLRAHRLDDIADELVSLHKKVGMLLTKVEQLEKRVQG